MLYNVRVAANRNYIANGILVHNCDDPHNLENIESETIRNEALEWYRRVWSSRLNDPKLGCRVVIMQRGHERDVAELCMSQEYTHLNLPNEFDPERKCVTMLPSVDPKRPGTTVCARWEDPRTEPGELLCPERLGAEETADLKRILGAYNYAAQFQQLPAPAGGGIFVRDWFRFYVELPESFDEVVSSWDLTFKNAEGSDFVVGQVWGREGAGCYLLYQMRAKLDFVGTIKAFRTVAARYPDARTKLVEEAANGAAVISTLKHEIPGIIPVSPQGSKVSRAHAVAPYCEAGNVWLPYRTIAPWIEDFIYETSMFPNGAHDDQVDAMTQALMRLCGRPRRRLTAW